MRNVLPSRWMNTVFFGSSRCIVRVQIEQHRVLKLCACRHGNSSAHATGLFAAGCQTAAHAEGRRRRACSGHWVPAFGCCALVGGLIICRPVFDGCCCCCRGRSIDESPSPLTTSSLAGDDQREFPLPNFQLLLSLFFAAMRKRDRHSVRKRLVDADIDR